MKIIVDKWLLFVLVFLLFSCSQDTNSKLEKAQQKIDSLSNELKKATKQQPNRSNENNSSAKSTDDLRIC